MVTVTALFAGVLALLYIWLSFQVIKIRRSERISLGDGANKKMQRAMRVQANFAEYTPFTLLLMALMEIQGAWPLWVLLTGSLLLAGRCLHAYGFMQERENLKLRVHGMQCTFASLALGAVTNIILALY